jgi:FkbM family methyltransferase
MKEFLKKLINLAGYDIYNIHKTYLPNDDAYLVKKRLLKNIPRPVIFDVGAFDGSVSVKYSNIVENSRIYAFEPSKSSYDMLLQAIKGKENIYPYNLGLGNSNRKSTFHLNNFAPTSSLLPSIYQDTSQNSGNAYTTIKTVEIDIVTIDDFCTKNNISRIDLLKIDTQGTEYQVIEGAKNMINEGRIGMIYTEIITIPTYTGQVMLHEFLKLIHDFGFNLFNFYNYEFHEGQLGQMDAIFVPGQQMNKNG